MDPPEQVNCGCEKGWDPKTSQQSLITHHVVHHVFTCNSVWMLHPLALYREGTESKGCRNKVMGMGAIRVWSELTEMFAGQHEQRKQLGTVSHTSLVLV